MAADYIALRFHPTEEGIGLLEGFFLSRDIFAGAQEHDDGSVTYFVPQSDWTDTLQGDLKSFCAANKIELEDTETIEDRDWNADWEATVLPQWATKDLLLSPSWRKSEALEMKPKYLITIDPKMSFGTGHHETTRLCLEAIELLDVADKHVLDIGTGTGVLAIYALLRGAKSAVAIDTDHWSFSNSIENRQLNDLDELRLSIRMGTLAEAVRDEERFEIALANIHRNVLIDLAAPIRSHMLPGGMLVLSGILKYDAADVREAYESAGFRFDRELQENEWSCLIFQNP